jgi:hypothetical protein
MILTDILAKKAFRNRNYVVEKKIPGRRIEFTCLDDPCCVTASKPVPLVAA